MKTGEEIALKAKQIIVVRKDLNMRKGKIAAQSAHASMAVILDCMKESVVDGDITRTLILEEGTALYDWLEGKFTKVCVSVNSEDELLEIYRRALDSGLICSLIQDAGITEFKGIPTYTCVAVGPGYENEIDAITGHLPLL